ncbi:UNVERIFIED_CONTAM: hypothetical protein Sangu_1175500 [Sesamum angustifolium]|uniref:MULE transposase domain-containing protein n=1 Tax=Sesamum angustifolium TaxID=2727405 RepID=A0AAW2NJY5_9LAMI
MGFDGCHLKGPFGVLLAAIGLDGNNGLFPVAVVVAESECRSWMFFFENLSRMLGGFTYDKPWIFMSDRQKGLVETINKIVPHAINRRCARHIYANFQNQFAGAALKRYFWQAARSYNAAGFNFAMYKIKEFKPEAYDWLFKIPAEMWSRHAFDPRGENDHYKGKDSELDVPLSQLARNLKKTKGVIASRKRKSNQQELQSVRSKKTKVGAPLATISSSQPIGSSSQQVSRPPISSSQQLLRIEKGLDMQGAGSSSQPPSHLGASYLPSSFWKGIGVSHKGR